MNTPHHHPVIGAAFENGFFAGQILVADRLFNVELPPKAHSHTDRCRLANLMRERGYAVDRTFTKVYRRKHG